MSNNAVRRLDDWDTHSLLELATEYGTPAYITDLDRIAANIHRISGAFNDARVMYAAKAHTGKAVLKTVLDSGLAIECAAQGELRRAIIAGADPDTLQYTAVNPPAGDLDYAVSLAADHPGMTITAGARDTFDRLADRGYDGRIAIRVNPGIGSGHHEKVATGADAKFGIPAAEVPTLAEEIRPQFDLVGIHAHIGSGVLTADIEDHCAAIERVAAVAAQVGNIEFLDIGGGFGVPYHEDEDPLDIVGLADRIRAIVAGVDAELAIEPGRYIVADASLILTQVNTVKETPETTVVGVDASLATLIRPAMFDAYHPIRNVSTPDRSPHPVSVGGPCCTGADVFCTDRPIARPARGDILAIGNAGAYGYELANQFHSQPRPPEIVLSGGTSSVARRRETLADVVHLETNL